MDKHAFLHRLNVFERMLAFVMKSISQDKWARHALMVYLVLVHIFALMYVLQVMTSFFFLKKVIYASHNVYACICRMYLFVSMYA